MYLCAGRALVLVRGVGLCVPEGWVLLLCVHKFNEIGHNTDTPEGTLAPGPTNPLLTRGTERIGARPRRYAE